MVTTARKPFGGQSAKASATTPNLHLPYAQFEQMEMEFFVEPSTAPEWHKYWIGYAAAVWYIDLGI